MFAAEIKIITLKNTTGVPSPQQHISDKRLSAASNGNMYNNNISRQVKEQSYHNIHTALASDKIVDTKDTEGGKTENQNLQNNDIISPKNCKIQQHHNMYYHIPTTTGTTNRNKKYYQHQQQNGRHIQQFSNHRDKKNNNNNAVKNRNMIEVTGPTAAYNTDLSKTFTKINTVAQHNADNSKSISPPIIPNILSLSTNEAITAYGNSIPSISSKVAVSLSPKSLLNTSTASICSTSCCVINDAIECSKNRKSAVNIDCCWNNLVTPQTSSPSPSNLSSNNTSLTVSSESFLISSSSLLTTTSTSSFKAENNEDSFQESDLKLKNSSPMSNPTKKKSYWKNSNANSKSRNLSKRYSYPNQQGSTVAESVTSDVQNKNSTVDCIEKLKSTAGGFAGKSGTKHIAKNTTAMTTALATNTVSTTNTTTAATTSTSTSPSTSTLAVSKSTSTVKAASNSSTSTENSRMTLSSTSIATSTAHKPKSTKTAPKTTTMTFSNTPILVERPILTTYTMDFLHSVGFSMSPSGEEVNLGPSCPPSLYDNNSSRTVSARNAYSYSRARGFPRQISDDGGNNGNNLGDGIDAMGFSAREMHRYQQHHRQPQQLTIASFMQKEHSDNFVVGGSSRRSNMNGGDSLNSGNSGNVGLDYGNQHSYYNQQRFHCIYDPNYLQYQQQQYSAAIQHSYSTGNGGNVPFNLHLQHPRQYLYQKIQNNSSTSSKINQQYNRNVHHTSNEQKESNCDSVCKNVQQPEQLQQQQSVTKKQNDTSGSVSSCSSSSSSSLSACSMSSKVSGTAHRLQKGKSKRLNLPAIQSTNSPQQGQYQNLPTYQCQQYSAPPTISETQQSDQDVTSLTDVNTVGTASMVSKNNTSNVVSGNCSHLTQKHQHSAGDGPLIADCTSTMLCCNPNDHQQQLPSTCTESARAPDLGSKTCSNQRNDSISMSSASSHASLPTSVAYNDSESSSSHSTKVHSLKKKTSLQNSISISASSSASSISSLAMHNINVSQQAGAPLMLNSSPVETTYGAPFPPLMQQYQPQFDTQQQQYILPHQQPQTHCRNNGVIPYNEEVLDTITQYIHPSSYRHHSPHQVYMATDEDMNANPLATGSDGYWNSLQNSNNMYSQTTTQSCSGLSTSSSPPINDMITNDHQQQLHHQNPEDQLTSLSTADNNQSQQFQSEPSETVNHASGNTTHSGISQNQQSNQDQNQSSSSVPYDVYPQHNLLPSQLRPPATSSYDFFTPPDRFMARSHLIEAKGIPSALLNDSKWDTLSLDIWNKFSSSQQTETTYQQKMRLWRYLYILVKNSYPRFGLYLVGSTISGFGSDNSDIDMCLVSRTGSNVEPRMEALFNLTVLRDYLSKLADFEEFNLIEARVPILRFRDKIHHMEVDLNFNNCVGIKNTHLLYCYSQLDWRLRPMVLVTKLWAQYHDINNAKNMTISSYSLVLMVIHFLQYAVKPIVLPCLHDMYPEKFLPLRSNDFGYVDMNETIPSYESKNNQTLGELFLSFLEYYSCFDYTQFAISVRTGGLLPISVCREAKSLKNDIHQWRELCIEEPFDLTNTARSVYDFETFERVKAVFYASWKILHDTLDFSSIFTPIVTPPCINEPSIQNNTVPQLECVNENSVSLPDSSTSNDTSATTNPLAIIASVEVDTESNNSNEVSDLGATREPSETSRDEKDISYNSANGNDKNNNTLTALLS